MSADVRTLVEEARAAGVALILMPDGAVKVKPLNARIPRLLVERLRPHREAIRVLLLVERAIRSAEEIALETARSIRERRYPLTEDRVCAFPIGGVGETCSRCGAPWLEHYPPRGTA